MLCVQANANTDEVGVEGAVVFLAETVFRFDFDGEVRPKSADTPAIPTTTHSALKIAGGVASQPRNGKYH